MGERVRGMYQLGVRRRFRARHFLLNAGGGPESQVHAHDYMAQIALEGPRLQESGYLVDIIQVEDILDGFVARYRDQVLNELPEFKDLNPSIEHFARILCTNFSDALTGDNLCRIVVQIWENDDEWSSYSLDR